MNELVVNNNDVTYQGNINIEKIEKKGFDNSFRLTIKGEQELRLGFNISNQINQKIFIELFLTKNSKLTIKTGCCGCALKSSHDATFKITMCDGSSLEWDKSYNWRFIDIKDTVYYKIFNNTNINVKFSGLVENCKIKEDFKLIVHGQNNNIKLFSKQILKNSKSKIIERFKIKGNNNEIDSKAKVGLESSKSYIFMFSKATGQYNIVSSVCEEVFLTEDSVAKSLPLIYSSHGSNRIDHEAKIGEIEKEKLYYLINRGVSLDRAKMLII